MSFPPEVPAGNISGIYNYCFRWCERCPFTDRCMNYLALEDDADAPRLPRVFRELPTSFTAVIESLSRSCEAADYDWSELSLQVDREEVTTTDLSLSELDQLSRGFTVALLGWLSEAGRAAESPAWAEAEMVLRWYGTMVSSKMHRAVAPLEEPWPDTPPDNSVEGITSDGNGSAKIALLCMARCLAALSVMLERPGAYEEELLTFTIDLLRMQRGLRFYYPYASSFERAGFDEEEYQAEIEAYYEGHLPIDPFRDGPWMTRGGRAPAEEERRG